MTGPQVQFDDGCHFEGIFFPPGSIVDQSTLDPTWCTGILREGFAHVYVPPVPRQTSGNQAVPPVGPGAKTPVPQAALDALNAAEAVLKK
jgi:hypothetical protein